MKFETLSIREIRGIRQFDQAPNEHNLVIYGENGTGKSGVIDAIDFLLTGKMRRLSGDGTRDITLEDHGKHVAGKLEDAYVTAQLKVSDSTAITVKRTIRSKKLETSGGSAIETAILNDVLKGGQFALTRKELLKFIACEGSKRAEQVQSLLDLQEVEKIRSAINQAVSSLDRQEAMSDRVCQTSERQIDEILGLRNGDWQERTAKVNELRTSIGATEIKLQDKIDFTEGANNKSESKSLSKTKVKNLLGSASHKLHESTNEYNEIKELLVSLRGRPDLKKEIKSIKLVELGLESIEENACPLCDKEWELTKLRKHLIEKQKRAEEAKELKDKYEKLSAVVTRTIDLQVKSLQSLSTALESKDNVSLIEEISTSIEALNERKTNFDEMHLEPVRKYIEGGSALLVTEEQSWYPKVMKMMEELPEDSPTENAFAKLMSLNQPYATFIENQVNGQKVKARLTIVTLIKEKFEHARLSFLDNLYKQIQDGFSKYYSFVNPDDESDFPVELKTEGAALKLSVGFHEHGMHPPNALHSEGHQDIMGVCLYLALMQQLKGERFTFCLLDDVMMSIDTGHRRRLCELLKDKFEHTQFFITTHDRLWAEQLREVGIVGKKNLLVFRSWSIEHGPIFDNKDVWEGLLGGVDEKEVTETAASLRRLCEQDFSEISSNLRAPIPYKNSQSWTLGDFRPAAYSRFKKLLGAAKEAESHWNHNDKVEKVEKILEDLKSAEEDSKINWQTNKAIHFTKWGELSRQEMKPTIEAMKCLLDCFRCKTCQAMMTLNIPHDKFEPTNMGCPCGETSFTLVKK